MSHVLMSGDHMGLHVTGQGSGYSVVECSVERKIRFGATAYPGEPTKQTLSGFPGMGYMRDFGKDLGDTDSLPELPSHTSMKMTLPGPDVLVHVSWKDDVNQLPGWLNGLTRPILLTWWHEPHGDMTPAAYRATAAKLQPIISAHPRGHLVLGHGPAVTRYWMDDKPNTNPMDWWYGGATFFGIDAYNDGPKTDTEYYPSAEYMFSTGVEFARSLGVPFVVPEYGLKRITADATGQGRAGAMSAHGAWLRQQSDCLAVGWWNHGENWISTGADLEVAAWRGVIAGS